MSEDNKDPKVVRIPLEKHLWSDEKEEKYNRQSNRNMTIVVLFSIIVTFVMGWLLGGITNVFSNPSVISATTSGITKFDTILDVMSNKWYFASQDNNIEEHLIDSALYGMTSQNVDPHTTYMSADELESFYGSINNNFVGIGVQFIGEGNTIERVFINSPAEQAGVQAGDIIHSVNGVIVDGLSTDEIAELVKGEEGTKVTIVFIRDGKELPIDIVRAPVSSTAYGYMINDTVGYLEIMNFGDSTSDEVREYLTKLTNQGMNRLIIDLRDDGGGYLDAVENVASYFLEKDKVVLQQEYPNGTIQKSKSKGKVFENIESIVVLANENTASAAEVLVIALKEQRNDVTIVGTTTYGKGTVQVSEAFNDGSALKYTSSRWLSPSGTWVNDVGITPDVEVKLHDVLYMSKEEMEEGTVYDIDSVSSQVKLVQNALDFLGYSVDRKDGYFDQSTKDAIIAFEKDKELNADGIIDVTSYDAIVANVTKEWSTDKNKDNQLQRGIEIINE